MNDKPKRDLPQTANLGELAAWNEEDEDVLPTDETRQHISRVLIVDDTPEHARAIQAALNEKHILTFHEASGAKTLRRYREIRPDLVLLDLNLPDMTGWELLDALKEARAVFSRPLIVVITNLGDPANRLMGRLHGVDSHLVKPFPMKQLVDTVLTLLGKQGHSAPPALTK